MVQTAFFAYPAEPADLAATIKTACGRTAGRALDVVVSSWPQMEVFGDNIGKQVRSSINSSDVLIADITFPNRNVYYEIGYAIGLGKSIAPVLNVSFKDATKHVHMDGFFDTIGYQQYENSEQLLEIFLKLPNVKLLELYAKPINATQPLYLIDTVRKTDFRNSVVSSVKSAKIFYRSFDPVETYRFSTVTVVSDVSASSGVIVPFLSESIDDAMRHNLRASFLAGLSHGMSKLTMIVQVGGTAQPPPADFRDQITVVNNEDEIAEKVVEFCNKALLATQEPPAKRRRSVSKLQALSLGASAAENEFRLLENYFVETSEYVRTQRGEVSVVSGRKGSGKTAIFFMVRDYIRSRKQTSVTDLKPESHQLSLFRQEILKLVDVGVFDHTLAAFWYFVFLTEMLFTIRRDKLHTRAFDSSAMTSLSDIDDVLREFDISSSGDFTSRINRLSSSIIFEINSAKSQGKPLSPESLTNIVFRGGITRIKQLVISNTTPKTRIVLLFDNIDKGWPTQGVQEFDVRMIRLMVESLEKIRRDMHSAERDMFSVVFLRNDIYELLVEQTPDRGKAGQIRIDWNDPIKLRQVIYKRLQSSSDDYNSSFAKIWSEYFAPQVGGVDSFDYCVAHCLMRPRFLITIIENAVANAINRGNSIVREDDIVDAVRQHSNYLISEFGFEIRDASGLTSDILFELIGLPNIVTKESVISRFAEGGIDKAKLDYAFDLMLWYGVIGYVKPDGSEKYIYDYDYSIKRLNADIRHAPPEAKYSINPALMAALR